MVFVFARATPVIIMEIRMRMKTRPQTFFTTASTNLNFDLDVGKLLKVKWMVEERT